MSGTMHKCVVCVSRMCSLHRAWGEGGRLGPWCRLCRDRARRICDTQMNRNSLECECEEATSSQISAQVREGSKPHGVASYYRKRISLLPVIAKRRCAYGLKHTRNRVVPCGHRPVRRTCRSRRWVVLLQQCQQDFSPSSGRNMHLDGVDVGERAGGVEWPAGRAAVRVGVGGVAELSGPSHALEILDECTRYMTGHILDRGHGSTLSTVLLHERAIRTSARSTFCRACAAREVCLALSCKTCPCTAPAIRLPRPPPRFTCIFRTPLASNSRKWVDRRGQFCSRGIRIRSRIGRVLRA
ncbi:hypothetical protein LXA43DRAFT_438301 [Ganoderma leucocontextum]|nr:hypothetical protein LXA43DRAFT_438301 [Ganoderma leucocontextum]